MTAFNDMFTLELKFLSDETRSQYLNDFKGSCDERVKRAVYKLHQTSVFYGYYSGKRIITSLKIDDMIIVIPQNEYKYFSINKSKRN